MTFKLDNYLKSFVISQFIVLEVINQINITLIDLIFKLRILYSCINLYIIRFEREMPVKINVDTLNIFKGVQPLCI